MSTPPPRPAYTKVLATFARNSLVRDMTFRSNFVIEVISSMSWVCMNIGFYVLIFQFTDELGKDTGWGKYEFFVFIATTLLINSLVQALFMPNCEEFSELIRTGNLDFALLKPIDTQFIISFHKVGWSSLGNFFAGLVLLAFSLWKLDGGGAASPTGWLQVLLYPLFVVCGVAIMYSLMISLSATSIWLGRNQTLYNFWFYITNFSRYPMEIYGHGDSIAGLALRNVFTFAIPILVAVNVPARLLARPLTQPEWRLVAFAIVATIGSLLASRWVFKKALLSYRSASS